MLSREGEAARGGTPGGDVSRAGPNPNRRYTVTSDAPNQPNWIPAITVSEDDRENFLPNLFGRRHFFIAEPTLYSLMECLSPQDYGGGFWDFKELNGQALYMVPPEREGYRIQCDGNGYSGQVSADAAGIIVTLFALSHLSFKFESDVFATGYNRLRDYADGHPEASAIYLAID